MRKTERGGGNGKPEALLEENKRGGLETFLRRENEKNLRYLLMVPYQHVEVNYDKVVRVPSGFTLCGRRLEVQL